MVWVRSPVYFYKRNETFYFSRAVPSELRHCFNKKKIEVSLRTKSEVKAAQSAAALSDRLERYWDSLRMEMVYSKELGLTALPPSQQASRDVFTMPDALALYHRLKGKGKKPAVAIFDTDGFWGKYEHRIWTVSKSLNIRFIWFYEGDIVEIQ